MFYYQSKIRSPLLKFKERDIQHYDLRADYRQVLCLKDYDEEEMNKIFQRELVMDDDTASFKEKRMYDDDERQTIQSLEESAHYYEKYIYRTLLNVEHAEEYSILAQQEQDKLRLEEE